MQLSFGCFPINVLYSFVNYKSLKPKLRLNHLEKMLAFKVVALQEALLTSRPQDYKKKHKPHINSRTVSHDIVFHSCIIMWLSVGKILRVHTLILRSLHLMHICCLLYLNKSEEMWIALHLPACEFKVVFLFPTVMLIRREALMEL